MPAGVSTRSRRECDRWRPTRLPPLARAWTTSSNRSGVSWPGRSTTVRCDEPEASGGAGRRCVGDPAGQHGADVSCSGRGRGVRGRGGGGRVGRPRLSGSPSVVPQLSSVGGFPPARETHLLPRRWVAPLCPQCRSSAHPHRERSSAVRRAPRPAYWHGPLIE